jgi:hypothetical protein
VQQTGVAWQPGSYALTAAFAEPLIKIVTSTVGWDSAASTSEFLDE